MLAAVREYVGISAGALCAFCLCIGCSLAELRAVVEQLNFGLMRDLDPETMLNFPSTYGLDTGAGLEKLLVAILKGKRLAPGLTFAELAAAGLGPRLRVFATDLNTCTLTEFSAAATPDAEVRVGLRASMSIPLYFAPVVHPISGHLLTDGGIINHSPFPFLTDAEKEHTLALVFDDSHKPKEDITSVFGFLAQVYFSVYYHQARAVEARWAGHVLPIPCGSFVSTHFEASQEEKQGLLEAGRRGAEAFLASAAIGAAAVAGPRRRPVRRFSAV